MYAIVFVAEAVSEIKHQRPAVRARILDEIEAQLSHEPAVETRRRRMLAGLDPPWEQIRPVWQLRLGDWRVFYDVDEVAKSVIVRAVRKKGRKRTEEVL